MSDLGPGYEKKRRELRRRLADNLRQQRVRVEITQETLAERVGFSLQYVQRIEREIVNVPLDTIARFAHIFQVDFADLLRQPRSSRYAATEGRARRKRGRPTKG